MTAAGDSMGTGIREWAGPQSGRGVPVRVWLLPAAVLVSAAVLVVARLVIAGPGVDRVWAEDGAVFWTDAKNIGLGAHGLTYSGYLHVLPRLIASSALLLPMSLVAKYVVVVVALVTGLLASLVFVAARRAGANPVWAGVAGLWLALVPQARVESIGNLANLQWLLLACLAWLSVTGSTGRLPHLATAAVAGLTALSTPLAVLVAPALLLVHGPRAGLRHPVMVPLLAGLVLQTLAMVTRPASPFVNPAVRHPDLGAVYALAEQVLPMPMFAPDTAFVLFAVLVVLTVTAAAWTLPQARAPFVGLIGTAVLLLGTVTVVNGYTPPRYWVAPAVLLVGAGGLWLSRRSWWAQAAVLGAVLIVAAAGFPAAPYRLSGPSWAEQVAGYNAACAGGEPAVTMQWSPAGWGSSRVKCP